MSLTTKNLDGKIRIAWYSDGPCVNTGFGVAAHGIVSRLAETGKYHIACASINERGDNDHPLKHHPNVTIVPIPFLDRDPYGYEVLPRMFSEFQPDIIIAFNDIWLLTGHQHHGNVGWFYNLCKQYAPQAPIVVYFPVDGEPFHRDWIDLCDKIERPVVYSEFGVRVVREAGYRGKLDLIYHGADLSKFFPLPTDIKKRQRAEFGIPEDHYLIGIVGRNQPRKNIPIAIRAIKMLKDGYVRCDNCKKIYSPEFKVCPVCLSTDRVAGEHFEGIKKVSTYLHMNLDDRRGHKLRKVIPDEKLVDVVFDPNHNIAHGVPQEKLNMIYNSFDVMFLPTTSEGFGLPILESMAAGTPVVATSCTSVIELLKEDDMGPKGVLIPPSDYMIMDDAANTRKFIIDVEKSVHALKDLLENEPKRKEIRANALLYASERDWDTPAKQFDSIIKELLDKRVSIVDSFKSGTNKQKIFCIRQVGDGGDLLSTLPAIRGVKESVPEIEIVYAVPNNLVDLIKNVKYIDNVIPVERLWEGTRLAKGKVSIAKFDFYGPEVKYEQATMRNVDKSRQEIFIHSTGFKPKSIDLDYIVEESEKQYVDESLSMFDPNFKKVFLKVDAPESYKAWPHDEWAKLIASLSRFKDLLVLACCDDNSLDKFLNIKLEEENKGRVLIINESEIGIRKAIAFMSKSNLLVSSDGPYIHYAGALKVPILGLYGPIDFKARMKHYQNANVIVKNEFFSQCLPCWRNAQTPCSVNNSLEHSACMFQISVGEVFSRISSLLNTTLSRAASKKRKKDFANA